MQQAGRAEPCPDGVGLQQAGEQAAAPRQDRGAAGEGWPSRRPPQDGSSGVPKEEGDGELAGAALAMLGFAAWADSC